jgi:hypothetical protein
MTIGDKLSNYIHATSYSLPCLLACNSVTNNAL